MSQRHYLGAMLAFAVSLATAAVPSVASAQERSACVAVNRANLIDCALKASLSLRSEAWATQAAEGRLQAASPWLPSNPVLAFALAHREEIGGQRSDQNWTAGLSQELEIAGQRGTRRAVASAELDAAKQHHSLVMREVAAAAWTAYFQALAARESEQAATRLEAAMTAIALAFRGISAQGLASGVDADLAQVAALNAQQGRRAAERRRVVADIELATALGVEPEAASAFGVAGDLAPLSVSDTAGVPALPDNTRPELAILQAERQAFQARASTLRRARVPNVTLNVFAQRDGFAERVYGVGLALPLPLPYPVGRTYAGEIREAEALAQQVETEVQRTQRELRGNLAIARAEYLSRLAALQTFTPERLAQAEQTLHDTAEQVSAGRIGIRDAIFAERTLIEFLDTNIEARRAICLASVALARAAGMALERGAQ